MKKASESAFVFYRNIQSRNFAKKESKSGSKDFASIIDNTAVRKLAAVKIINDVSDKKSKGQITKLHLNKDIYLELPMERDIKDLQKLFQVLGIIAR